MCVQSQIRWRAEVKALKASKKNLKWWTQGARDNDTKWESLIHNGVIFPPAYEPLPAHVKLLYEGKPVALTAAQVMRV
jgi:DNA topoisomerase-1